MQKSRLIYYINPCDKSPDSSLYKLISPRLPKNREIIFLCIGTSRLTGDSLGPFTGTALKDSLGNRAKVYGTLREPVHAMNFEEVCDRINRLHQNPYIVAVDACLGRHIGSVTLSEEGLVPAAGVGKPLKRIGQLSITGIVAPYYGNPISNLSAVPLKSVVELSNTIVSALERAFKEIYLPF